MGIGFHPGFILTATPPVSNQINLNVQTLPVRCKPCCVFLHSPTHGRKVHFMNFYYQEPVHDL